MTSHIVVEALDPERPATFSPTVLGLLRHELGFDGVVVSDALDMAGASARAGIPEAAVRALEAGVDLLCLGSRTTPQRYAAVHAAVREAVGSGRLARGRVGEAADRVRGLAAAGRAPQTSAPPPDLPLGRVARTFFLSERARRWLAAGGEHVVVQVDSVANPAVGDVPWGPAAVTSTVAETAVPRGARVAVVGRGVGPDHPARRAADRLSTDGHEVVLVDCGWPRGGADIETFGGSPAVARALLALLRGELRG